MASESSLFEDFLKGLRERITTEDDIRNVEMELAAIRNTLKKTKSMAIIDNMGLNKMLYSLKEYDYDTKRIGCVEQTIAVKVKNHAVRRDDDDKCTDVLDEREMKHLIQTYKNCEKDNGNLGTYMNYWLAWADPIEPLNDIYAAAELESFPDERWINVGDWDDPLHLAWVTISVFVYFRIPTIESLSDLNLVYKVFNFYPELIEYVRTATIDGIKMVVECEEDGTLVEISEEKDAILSDIYNIYDESDRSFLWVIKTIPLEIAQHKQKKSDEEEKDPKKQRTD